MSSAVRAKRQASRPTGETIQRVAPMPGVRPFRDTDSPMLRSSFLLADTDEWHQTHDRVRLFRNGDVHFAIAEVTSAGNVHPAINAMIPWADGMPGCAVLITLTTDQAENLLEALR